ncbi:hypothetical protein CI610_00294 [invertebrate metagenome]|uniref:Uncharacterized protein n=1 Tax=invertebrate metagenome TaxID=1711999 RepID=A0A2H9TC10_9ZZZZ
MANLSTQKIPTIHPESFFQAFDYSIKAINGELSEINKLAHCYQTHPETSEFPVQIVKGMAAVKKLYSDDLLLCQAVWTRISALIHFAEKTDCLFNEIVKKTDDKWRDICIHRFHRNAVYAASQAEINAAGEIEQDSFMEHLDRAYSQQKNKSS